MSFYFIIIDIVLAVYLGYVFRTLFFKGYLERFIITFGRSADVALNRHLEDEVKEKALKKDFLKLGKHLFLIFLFFSFAVAPFFVLEGFHDTAEYLFQFREFLYSWLGIVILSLFSLWPFFLNSKSKSGYSKGAKLLHRIWLDNSHVAWLSFKIEKTLHSKRLKKSNAPYFIVTGLARSGTTALLYTILPLGFSSLTYRNMPYLLSPNLLSRLNRKKSDAKERSHGDGVEIGYDQAEAFEEYFWKCNLNLPSSPETLGLETVTELQKKEYSNYRKLIAKKGPYLAKNNNFLLRYLALKEDQDLRVLMMFRAPLNHAYSLCSQHKNYLEQQEEDPFVLEYMNWLGHFEFGKNQKEFQFGKHRKESLYSKDDINYWLSVWIEYYSYVLSIENTNNIVFINHESLAAKPQAIKEYVCNLSGLPLEESKSIVYKNKGNKLPDLDFDTDLYKQSEQLYLALSDKAVDF